MDYKHGLKETHDSVNLDSKRHELLARTGIRLDSSIEQEIGTRLESRLSKTPTRMSLDSD